MGKAFFKWNLIKQRAYHLRTKAAAFIAVMVLVIPMSVSLPVGNETAYAAGPRLSLETAKALAVAKSSKLETINLQIQAKTTARESAIESLKERRESMMTLRWSPLLNFKLPTTPNAGEEFEFAFKPTQLLYEINTLKHKKNDVKLTTYEKVSNIYIDIISSTAEEQFLTKRVDNMAIALQKNRAKLVLGAVSDEIIKTQETKLTSLKSKLASEKSKLVGLRKKLGKEMNMNIGTSYRFSEEFVAMNVSESVVDALESNAIENDHTVFEARQEMELAKLTLLTNYNILIKA